jgi:hypothetical protein
MESVEMLASFLMAADPNSTPKAGDPETVGFDAQTARSTYFPKSPYPYNTGLVDQLLAALHESSTSGGARLILLESDDDELRRSTFGSLLELLPDRYVATITAGTFAGGSYSERLTPTHPPVVTADDLRLAATLSGLAKSPLGPLFSLASRFIESGTQGSGDGASPADYLTLITSALDMQSSPIVAVVGEAHSAPANWWLNFLVGFCDQPTRLAVPISYINLIPSPDHKTFEGTTFAVIIESLLASGQALRVPLTRPSMTDVQLWTSLVSDTDAEVLCDITSRRPALLAALWQRCQASGVAVQRSDGRWELTGNIMESHLLADIVGEALGAECPTLTAEQWPVAVKSLQAGALLPHRFLGQTVAAVSDSAPDDVIDLFDEQLVGAVLADLGFVQPWVKPGRRADYCAYQFLRPAVADAIVSLMDRSTLRLLASRLADLYELFLPSAVDFSSDAETLSMLAGRSERARYWGRVARAGFPVDILIIAVELDLRSMHGPLGANPVLLEDATRAFLSLIPRSPFTYLTPIVAKLRSQLPRDTMSERHLLGRALVELAACRVLKRNDEWDEAWLAAHRGLNACKLFDAERSDPDLRFHLLMEATQAALETGVPDLVLAKELCTSAQEDAARRNARAQMLHAKSWLAIVAMRLSDRQESGRLAEEVYCEVKSDAYLTTESYHPLLRVALLLSNSDEAQEALHTCIMSARASGDWWSQREGWWGLSVVLSATGHPDDSTAAYDEHARLSGLLGVAPDRRHNV